MEDLERRAKGCGLEAMAMDGGRKAAEGLTTAAEVMAAVHG